MFLKTLVGLYNPDEGEILYDGRSIQKMSVKEKKLLRNEMGMLFQGNALFDSLTVEENVRFPLDMFTDMSLAENQNTRSIERKLYLVPEEVELDVFSFNKKLYLLPKI